MSARTRRLAANAALALLGLVASLALAELAFWAYSRLVIFPRWDRDMAKPNFFLARSADPILAYELAPGFEIETDGKRLHINRFGVREDTDERYEGRYKIAILGDSVTNGAGHSQDATIDALLEARLRAAGSDAVVLNFGVPGYATRELAAFLAQKNAIYRVDRVVYLLNPNDFARRDSIYEGADNGLYRMFVRPDWKTPWFARKAVYRAVKGGGLVSMRWYRWMFEGNEASAQRDIRAMAVTCASQGAAFAVVLMPSGEAFGAEGFALAEMYERLESFLRQQNIPVLAPVEAFAEDPKGFFDPSDHFTDAGNQRMADVMAGFLTELAPGADPAPPAAARN